MTLSRLVDHLRHSGVDVLVVASDEGATMSVPLYGGLRVSREPWRAIPRIAAFRADAIHVATEGPLGMWTRLWLGRHRLPFTTSFHTRFPEYLSARLPLSVDWGYRVERWFHSRAVHTMVGTVSLIRELEARNVARRLVHWPRGVDTDRFHPEKRSGAIYANLPRPIWLNVGRVAVEKSLEAFLGLPLPGTKVIVGDGPDRAKLERRFPDAIWRGWQHGDDLSAHYASADCFVFPSKTETFGNVLLEAMASGLPVAAVPSPGPIDLVQDGWNGAIDDSLLSASLRAQHCSRVAARTAAAKYSWPASHETFRRYLVPLGAVGLPW